MTIEWRRLSIVHRFAWLLVATVLGSHAISAAQLAEPLSVVGEIPMGTLDRVAAEGALAVALHGPRLVTLELDMEGGGPPRLRGYSDVLPAPVGDVALTGELALVAAGVLQVIDLTDRDRPALLDTLDIAAARVEVDPEHAPDRALALGDALHVIDLGTPSAPAILGSAAVTGRAVAFDGEDQRAYVAADGEGLHLVDLADPTAPRVVGRFTDARAWGVAAAEGFVFVADPEAGLRVLDWRDPSSPTQIAIFALPEDVCNTGPNGCPFAADVLLNYDRLHVAFARGISAFGSRDPAPVITLDITDPSAPRELARRPLDGSATDLVMSAAGLLVAERPLWWYAGIAPCQLKGGGLLQLGDGLSLDHRLAPPIAVNGLVRDGARLLGADVTPIRVRAWDVSDPTSPTPLERPGARGFGSSYGSAEARDIALTAFGPVYVLAGQTMGFVTQAAGDWAASPKPPSSPHASASASTLDIDTTSAPPHAAEDTSTLLNGCAPPSSNQWFSRIEPLGEGVALLDVAGHLRLFDAGFPARNPTGSYEDLAATDLAVDGDLVHLIGSTSYEIVDASDRTQPRRVGGLDFGGRSIALRDGRAYVGGDDGLAMIDVRTADDPAILGQASTDAPVDDVLVAGNHAYAAVGGRVLAFAITGDGAPREVARAEQPEGVRRLHAAGEHLYTIDRGGVSILALLEGDRLDPPTPRPATPTPSPSPTVTVTVTPGPSPTPGLLLPIGLRGAALR